MVLKFVFLGSIICIVSIKIRFKAIHHLQSLENLRFLLPPLILWLYTGCRLGQNFSKSIIGFQKVKVLNYKGYKCPSFFQKIASSYEIYLKLWCLSLKRWNWCLSVCFEMLSPLDPRCPLDNWTSLYKYTTCVKGALGRGGGLYKWKKNSIIWQNRPLCKLVVFIVHQLYKYI